MKIFIEPMNLVIVFQPIHCPNDKRFIKYIKRFFYIHEYYRF